ncbi:IPT/TIG domain-containing protein [Mucilaginibacter glaciei]|uniref:IPT/TIG domain-containing protein n=1 Tax=Mucilaginibacter glaciei TaxID=2772109 RepID=A0A926NZD7_9SPHI|nr:IPT/TIG domain-containing protein [Mucilaginibacter glaciei]MBD1394459.1 IPT/TIG domain-containing protein [Mucilaginibacter glaciei]
MFIASSILKRPAIFALVLILQILGFGCKKDKQFVVNTATLPVITTMEFYTYNGERYSDGPHYYNKYILNNLGVPNSVILINGHNFSQDFKESTVLFNNIIAPVIFGDSTSIQVMIPDQVPPGPVTLTIYTNGKSYVHPGKFTVETPDPQITGLNVVAGMRGGRVIILGVNFSTTASKTSVSVNGIPAVVDSATLKAIYLKTPSNAASGKIVLTTHGKTLTYKDDFKITSSTFTTVNNVGLRLISFDAAGNIYGTDQNRIAKITPAGAVTVLTKAGTEYISNGFFGVNFGGAVADASGTMYFTSPFQSNGAKPYTYPDFTLRLMKVLPDGSFNAIAGGSYSSYADGQGAEAKFIGPTKLVLNAATGNFYINDASIIRKVTPSGLVSTVANARVDKAPVTLPGFIGVNAMALQTTTGDVYLIDNASRYLAKITPAGVITTTPFTVATGTTFTTTSVYGQALPADLAVNASGTLFLALGNNLYQIKDGVVTNTFANPAGGNIMGLAVDNSGTIYLSAAESFNPYDYNVKYTLYKVTL